MPYICCDVQEGLSDRQKETLVDEIIRITHTMIGSPLPYIHVAIREFPKTSIAQSGARGREYGRPSHVASD